MRPYLAILKDSFREAMASRVLLILLIFATVLLLALAPISLEEKGLTNITHRDFVGGNQFLETLKSDAAKTNLTPAKQIYKYVKQEYQNHPELLEQKNFTQRYFLSQLNKVLQERELYDPAAWKSVPLTSETERFIKNGVENLDEYQIKRLNRLLIETAYPQFFVPINKKEVYLGYAFSQLENPLPWSKEKILTNSLNQFTNYALGVFGIMIAILVTASAIPKIYEAGAVDLLLSKPLSRSAVFLTHFFGGCVFILLITSFLIVGIWLIAGWRHDYWNHQFLLCIPLLLFLFAIYYGVSALVGVIWKNAIISIFLTVCFWFFCFGLWFAKNTYEGIVMAPQTIATVVPMEDGMLLTNANLINYVELWNGEREDWELSFKAPIEKIDFQNFQSYQLPGLRPIIYDSHHHRLLTIGTEVIDEKDKSATNKKPYLFVGENDGQWKRTKWSPLPEFTSNVFVTRAGKYFAVGGTGIYEVTKRITTVSKDHFTTEKSLAPATWKSYNQVAMSQSSDHLVTLRGRRLTIYELGEDQKYKQVSSTEIKTGVPRKITYSGTTIAIAFGDGSIGIYNTMDLKLREKYQPYGNHSITQLHSSPDGKWVAAAYDHRKLWLLDTIENKVLPPNVSQNDDVLAIAFTAENHLAVATAFNHVTTYDPATLAKEKSFNPTLTTTEWIYWYLINPTYKACPKPGELGNMVNYLVTGKQTVTSMFSLPNEKVDVWQPIWSNLIFLSVLLCFACLYVQRKDF